MILNMQKILYIYVYIYTNSKMKQKLFFVQLIFFWYFFFFKNVRNIKLIKNTFFFTSYNSNNFVYKDELSILRLNKTNIQKKKKKNSKFKVKLVEKENDEGIHYELNKENVQKVLNLIRPKLQIDNGNVELVKIDNSDLYVKLLGECITCSSNSVTVTHIIKKTLQKYIRDKNNKEPNVIVVNFDDINETNIQNCLNDLKPYFDFLKVEVLIKDIVSNKEGINNSVSLIFKHKDNGNSEIKIPFNVRNEIAERLKNKFPTLTVHFEN
ncbi:NifU-like scaffold protein [Hepatocystis sp. ex Piliocolobus tephrosceles]|nr:NifU-like scaffold protein [Hepatocystis sp. ex Piliocolobus tephrosceles]